MNASPVRLIRPFHYVGPTRALRVGVTGGIGAGKTTVTSALAALGASVISSDQIARDLQGPGGEAVPAIRERFGEGVIGADGGIDRPALAHTVFADPKERADLENLVHPLIAQRAQQFFADAAPGTVAVYDIPLLVETGTVDYFDAVLVVWVDVAERIARLRRDRGMSREDALARIAAQASDAERERAAHAVIDNTGDEDATREAVAREVWPALLACTGNAL